VFAGEINHLIIDGRGHQHWVSPDALSADFSDCTLKDSSITGYHLQGVGLPEQTDLMVVGRYPVALRRAAAWLAGQGRGQEVHQVLGMIEHYLKAPGADDTDWCFDLHGIGDPDLELILGQALQHARGAV